jgi:acyl-CoA thioesterase FadM
VRLASASTTLVSLNGEGKLVALPDDMRKLMEDARS